MSAKADALPCINKFRHEAEHVRMGNPIWSLAPIAI
jgi:hypothetical protein